MRITPVYNGYFTAQTNNYISTDRVKITPTPKQWNELQVFYHHIYEYKKGLRNLILTTEKQSNRDVIVNRLERENISYLIQNIDDRKMNVFFGNPDSLKVIESFKQKNLKKYTPEQDFILGALLGYDKIQQCQRYLKMINKKDAKTTEVLIG